METQQKNPVPPGRGLCNELETLSHKTLSYQKLREVPAAFVSKMERNKTVTRIFSLMNDNNESL
jgi:hypothetical protein